MELCIVENGLNKLKITYARAAEPDPTRAVVETAVVDQTASSLYPGSVAQWRCHTPWLTSSSTTPGSPCKRTKALVEPDWPQQQECRSPTPRRLAATDRTPRHTRGMHA